ncbi:hypothetical protein MSIM_07150 [Mycobacterium simiae]|nr:hypothetical protein MSIM_07150 [Mycobacterium simiae]
MSEPNLDAPAEELKLVGNPIVEQTDAHTYDVLLPFSRGLAPGEIDFIKGLGRPMASAAGAVTVSSDATSLVVLQTTIELVREHLDSLKDVVVRIAAGGEEYRKRAVEAANRKAEDYAARVAEQDRRQRLADGINLDG